MSRIETLETVQAVGKQRLYPSLTNPNWLILRQRREIFKRWLKAFWVKNPDVLDIGGRIQPYRSLIVPEPKRYVAVDLRITPLVNIAANAERLPFADGQFDLVLCTQMLEYVPIPGNVLSEAYRVLRPGGILMLSVPSMALRDADEDRWRFWPAAIRQLLSSFREVEVVPEGGSVTGLFRTASAGLDGLAKYPSLRRLLGYTFVPILNVLGLALETLANSRHDNFAANYSVRAQK